MRDNIKPIVDVGLIIENRIAEQNKMFHKMRLASLSFWRFTNIDYVVSSAKNYSSCFLQLLLRLISIRPRLWLYATKYCARQKLLRGRVFRSSLNTEAVLRTIERVDVNTTICHRKPAPVAP